MGLPTQATSYRRSLVVSFVRSDLVAGDELGLVFRIVTNGIHLPTSWQFATLLYYIVVYYVNMHPIAALDELTELKGPVAICGVRGKSYQRSNTPIQQSATQGAPIVAVFPINGHGARHTVVFTRPSNIDNGQRSETIESNYQLILETF